VGVVTTVLDGSAAGAAGGPNLVFGYSVVGTAVASVVVALAGLSGWKSLPAFCAGVSSTRLFVDE
jgi:hypothetical protein